MFVLALNDGEEKLAGDQDRIARLYLLTVSRPPGDAQVEEALTFLDQYERDLATGSQDAPADGQRNDDPRAVTELALETDVSAMNLDDPATDR